MFMCKKYAFWYLKDHFIYWINILYVFTFKIILYTKIVRATYILNLAIDLSRGKYFRFFSK